MQISGDCFINSSFFYDSLYLPQNVEADYRLCHSPQDALLNRAGWTPIKYHKLAQRYKPRKACPEPGRMVHKILNIILFSGNY